MNQEVSGVYSGPFSAFLVTDDLPLESSVSSDKNLPKIGTEHWALMVSILALIVSGISLWDSHKISNIQIAQAAPDIEVKSAELLSLGDKTGDPKDFSLVMDAVNTGHLAVTVGKTIVHPNISELFDDGTMKACFEDLKRSTFTDDTGIEQTIRVGKRDFIIVNVRLADSCKGTGWRFFAEATFKGVDEVKTAYEQKVEISAIVPAAKH
jgi:hypothetical protein